MIKKMKKLAVLGMGVCVASANSCFFAFSYAFL